MLGSFWLNLPHCLWPNQAVQKQPDIGATCLKLIFPFAQMNWHQRVGLSNSGSSWFWSSRLHLLLGYTRVNLTMPGGLGATNGHAGSCQAARAQKISLQDRIEGGASMKVEGEFWRSFVSGAFFGSLVADALCLGFLAWNVLGPMLCEGLGMGPYGARWMWLLSPNSALLWMCFERIFLVLWKGDPQLPVRWRGHTGVCGLLWDHFGGCAVKGVAGVLKSQVLKI